MAFEGPGGALLTISSAVRRFFESANVTIEHYHRGSLLSAAADANGAVANNDGRCRYRVRRGLAAWRRVVCSTRPAEHVFVAKLPWVGVPTTVVAPSGRSFAASGYLAGSLRGARGDVIRADAARKPRASSSSARRQRAAPAVEETESFDDGVDREFWISQVTGPVKQSARLMVQRVDFSDPLGVDTSLRGASKGSGKSGGRKTLYDYALEVKAQHPERFS